MKKSIFSIFMVFILLFNNIFTWIVYSVDDVFYKLNNLSSDFDLNDDNIWDLWEQMNDIINEEVIDDVDPDNKDDAELESKILEDDIDDDIDLEVELEDDL